MLVKQISVFVENARGKLANVTQILADNGINIRALSIADTTDFGILRLIVDDPDKTFSALKEAGITVKATDVLVMGIDDRPNGLNSALTALRDASVTVEYMYAFVTKHENQAYVILKTDNPEKATEALTAKGIPVVPSEDVYEL